MFQYLAQGHFGRTNGHVREIIAKHSRSGVDCVSFNSIYSFFCLKKPMQSRKIIRGGDRYMFFVFAEGWEDCIFRENREGVIPNKNFI